MPKNVTDAFKEGAAEEGGRQFMKVCGTVVLVILAPLFYYIFGIERHELISDEIVTVVDETGKSSSEPNPKPDVKRDPDEVGLGYDIESRFMRSPIFVRNDEESRQFTVYPDTYDRSFKILFAKKRGGVLGIGTTTTNYVATGKIKANYSFAALRLLLQEAEVTFDDKLVEVLKGAMTTSMPDEVDEDGAAEKTSTVFFESLNENGDVENSIGLSDITITPGELRVATDAEVELVGFDEIDPIAVSKPSAPSIVIGGGASGSGWFIFAILAVVSIITFLKIAG